VALHLVFFCFPPPFHLPAGLRFEWPPGLDWPPSPDERLTFVTVPKPQTIPDQIEMAKIVLRVWLTYPFTQILMFSSPSEYDPENKIIPFVRDTFGPDRLSFGGNLSTGYEGRPLIRDWFTEGFRLVESGYIAFTNGDIIFTPLWMNTAMEIFDALADHNRTLVYGTRTDVHRREGVFNLSQTSPPFVHDLVRWLEQNVRCNNPWGMDVVLVHSSFNALTWSEHPDFVVGMCVWDNYFMGYANIRAATVSMNFGPKLYHVDHPPNACNDDNYDYFRGVSASSRHFNGFQTHSDAEWWVRLNEGQLVKRWHGDLLRFKRKIDDSISLAFR
jgi:hypothetical protein